MRKAMSRRDAVSLLGLLAGSLASGSVAVEAAPAGTSPFAVSDADLFAALDYAATPALAPVREAWQGNNAAGAKKAFAAYLRARTSVPWTLSPQVPDRSKIRWNTREAEAAKRGEVTVVAIKHTFPSARIDWFYSATGGQTGLPANNEWVWQLNRMGWWYDLSDAYRATGDETWARLWAEQMRSWVTQCPPPPKAQNTPGSAWRTIECGIRMLGAWPTMYHAFLLSPSVSDDDLTLLVRTMVAHGRYLSACNTGGNWLTMEMNGLYSVGALFPELKEAAAWRKQAADALYREQASQFLPDGAQYELTPGYHNVALDNVLGLYKRAQMVGRTAELPDDYVARMEQAFAFDLFLMTPDRSMPKFNDSWPYGVPKRMQEGAQLFPNRPDFAWIAADGKQGKPPAQTSHAFDYAGYYVMRDGWGRDACMAILDAGPLGYGHFHQDKLNVVAWAYGRELLFDSGGGSYEKSSYRSYATDTFGHNCVLVDNKPQRRSGKDLRARVADAPINARWQSTPTRDYAEGVYSDGYGTETDRIATHTRRLLFVKPTGAAGEIPCWLVADTLEPGDSAEHTYQARWNLLTTKTTTDSRTSITATTDEGLANLVVIPLYREGLTAQSASAQTEPELLGWNIRKDMDPQYVPATTVLHTRKGTGVQRFLTLLLPLKAGQPNPVSRVERRGATSVAVHLADGRTLLVTDSGKGKGIDGLTVAFTASRA